MERPLGLAYPDCLSRLHPRAAFHYASEHETVSRLVTIPGIGALGATALIAAEGDGRQFKKARDLAAWLGLAPAEHSTGGKQTLLGISKRGNRYVRRLIIHVRGHAFCF
ncbi:MAG: transposase [Rhodobacteraceae bacterium]|nr:transposase [Paracoccaceae bacterium]MCF8515268.1 transposase [Paracoccaceae bacterium]MCF8519548.1 transposase [Paracoccaceae bacterium]